MNVAAYTFSLVILLLGQPAQFKPTGPTDSTDPSTPATKRPEETDCGECCSLDFENCAVEDVEKKDARWTVCHFTNWAGGRKDKAKFTPDNIDPALCTHINYAFALLDSTTLTITAGNKNADEDQHYFEHVTAFKAKGLTVMMSIGGWVDSGDGDKWSRMIRSDSARANFVTSVMKFLEKNKFDGLDMGFSFPACPQGKRDAGLPTDREKYNQLLTELKAAFKGRFLLSVQATAKKNNIDECYDMPEVCDLVDWVNLMTYEYHNHAEGKTGAQAPICGSPSTFGVYETVKYYLESVKCPAHKLVLGIPFFAGTYTLKDLSQHAPQFGDEVTGPGAAGPYLNMGGYLSYYEVCMFLKDNWNKGHSKMNGDFIWKGNQFVTSPSVADVKRKSCLIKHFNLKGANFWTLDYDDFNNMCGCGNYPLLKTLNNQLRGLSDIIDCY